MQTICFRWTWIVCIIHESAFSSRVISPKVSSEGCWSYWCIFREKDKTNKAKKYSMGSCDLEMAADCTLTLISTGLSTAVVLLVWDEVSSILVALDLLCKPRLALDPHKTCLGLTEVCPITLDPQLCLKDLLIRKKKLPQLLLGFSKCTFLIEHLFVSLFKSYFSFHVWVFWLHVSICTSCTRGVCGSRKLA